MVLLRLGSRGVYCLCNGYLRPFDHPFACPSFLTKFYSTNLASFLPITLEQLARDQGVLLSDKKTPCSLIWNPAAHTPGTSPNVNSTLRYGASSESEAQPEPGAGACIVYILGAEVNTASFALYTFSLSVLVQAILIISMSGAADHGSYRKKLLLTFAYIGSIATMLFLAIIPRVYLVAAFLAIIANTCFGASFVLLNSFLPVLVRYHPTVLEKNEGNSTVPHDDPNGARGNPDSTTPLLQSSTANGTKVDDEEVTSLELKLSTKISSYGIGIGYIGAVTLQMLLIFVVVATKQTTFSLRLVLFLVGLWWFVFTIPAAAWLRPRPGPPLLGADGKPLDTWAAYISHAWKSLGKTVMRARRLKDICLFLAAWFLLSDGIATVSGTAVLFAKTQLDMKPAALGLINVIVMIAGVFGAFSWGYVSNFLGLRASQTIVVCILLFELIPIYGILGFVPSVQRLGIGLQQPWEMYPLGAVYGLVMGGLSSYCRSFFAELIPPGYEAAFYALYAITDKGSSIFGPAIVGMIADRYGEIRPAFVFLAILIILPLPLMLMVDVDRGKRDALELGAELDNMETTGYGTISEDADTEQDADAVAARTM